MKGGGVLVDSNIILDVFTDDPNWVDWSESIRILKNQHQISETRDRRRLIDKITRRLRLRLHSPRE